MHGRPWFAVLGALVAAMVAVNVAGAARDGALPVTWAWDRCSATVTSTDAAAAATGVRVGDRVDLRSLDPTTRMAFGDPSAGRATGAAGAIARLPLLRADASLTVRLPFIALPVVPFDVIFAGLGLLVYLVTGAVVLWRGRDVPALALGAFLLCFAAGGFAFDRTGFLPPAARVAFNVLAFALSAGAIYAGFTLNLRLSEGVLPQRVISVLRVGGTAYCVLYGLIVTLSQLALPLFGCTLPLFHAYVWLFFAGAVGVMAILGAAVVASRFRQTRLAWLFWTTVACLVPFILLRTAEALIGVHLMGNDALRVAVEGVPFLLLPVGYAYGILRYRVVDVSFVLNRALVFAMLSTALLGGVILVEAFAEKAALGKDASLALELVVPLAIGLSFNVVHKRLERLIDRLLFSAKHRADEALRAFIVDCAFIEKPDTLRARTVQVVREQSRASAAALYERTGTGYRLGLGAGTHAFPGDVDADDAAFVRMRSTLGPVELDGISSAMARAGIAFPLATAGRIGGALVCAPRETGEPYDPDERELLRAVAQSVAAAIATADARERARFVDEIAQGAIDLEQARLRARELRAEG